MHKVGRHTQGGSSTTTTPTTGCFVGRPRELLGFHGTVPQANAPGRVERVSAAAVRWSDDGVGGGRGGVDAGGRRSPDAAP